LPNYELTYILRPLEEANLTALNERITTIVTNAGGEIVGRNDWGRRRLAYPIRKNTDGYYTTLYITLPATAVRGIERSLQLNDDVLRYLVVRVETHRLPAAPAATPTPAVEAAPAEAPAAEPANATAETSSPPPAMGEPVAEATAAAAPAPAAEGS